MFKLFFIILVFSLSINEAFSKSISDVTHESIVGGTNTTIEEHPWQVALFVPKDDGGLTFICGGSIIGPKHVVTAAHCLLYVKNFVIRAGSSHYASGGILREAKPIIHPGKLFKHDIGLLVLEKEIELDGVKTKAVLLPNKDDTLADQEELVVTGWGTLKEDGDIPEQLQEVTVPVIGHSECLNYYTELCDSEICAGYPEGGKDSCQGDSGGPAVIKKSKTLVGIVSWGKGCARPNFPGVYANVIVHREWIREVSGI